MNTADNQRSRLTKMLLKQSYLRLMNEKQTGRITVKEICAYAEVNRSTFYLHYTEPNDILIELEDETIAQVKQALSAIGELDEDTDSAQNYLLSFLRHVQLHGELYRTFLIKNSDPHFRRKLQEAALALTSTVFQMEISPEQCRFVYLFLVSGSIEVLIDWIRSDFSIPEKEVCKILFHLCEGSLRGVCLPDK